MTEVLIVSVLLMAVGGAGVLALLRTAKHADLNNPMHPERLRAVRRAQDEIAFQAKYGRER